MADQNRPVALVTGASRRRGLGAAIGLALARSGWNVAITYWSTYDDSMEWGADTDGPSAIVGLLEAESARAVAVEADLADPASPTRIFDAVEEELGPVSGLALNHCECRPVALADLGAESLLRHFQVNVMANVSLIQILGERFPDGGRGRVVSLTSDHTVGNVPYGVTKAAADRVSLAAAYELAPRGITVNVVNPGPTDTGWMTEEIRADAARRTPLSRAGTPGDVANLVAFLFSAEGGWITGQLLYSNGGFRSSIA